MKKQVILGVAVAMVAGMSQATIIIDASTNNGSFETIDPHTAPITNAGGRRASSDGSAFTVANLAIDPGGGFGGIDGSQIGDPNPSAPNRGQDGDKTLLANNGVNIEVIFASIALTVNVGDMFDLSAYTGFNSLGNGLDYAFTLRFDGNLANDLVLLSGTDSAAADVWTQQSSGPVLATVAASSVELIVFNDNSNGGNDQTYIDNITLNHTAIPEPGTLALLGLGGLALALRRRRA